MKKLYLLALTILISTATWGQKTTLYVDKEGICRYREDNKDVASLGFNYTLPFSTSYRMHQELNLSVKESIDSDIYHLSRMGLDLFRVHIWEAEFTDEKGNLIHNDHLYWFDYLLAELKKHDIKAMITPLSFNFGNPSDGVESFVNIYKGKAGCLRNPETYPIQENYLSQLVNHVNAFTGIAYKDDENIIAYEITNEPNVNWGEGGEMLETYISRMNKALTKDGNKALIFHNISSCAGYGSTVCKSDVSGVTCQWYPSGLFERRSLYGNFLPNCDKYSFDRFLSDPNFSKKARFVYEYSPSSVSSYCAMYPAMARSFKEARIQAAAYFAYDVMQVAHLNMNYPSHYLNLIYTPNEALGMKIGSEIFRSTPAGKSFGRYPDNLEFDSYKLDAINNYAEMNSNEKFIYTSTTTTKPLNSEKLKEVAGCGSSPIVDYYGTGSYFLDKLEEGVWRVEIMPDVADVTDVMHNASYSRMATVALWNNHPFTIKLKELGDNFSVVSTNKNSVATSAINSTFDATPGVYIVSKKGIEHSWCATSNFKSFKVGTYYAPQPNCDKQYVTYTIPEVVSPSSNSMVTAQVVSNRPIDGVKLVVTTEEKKKYAVEMKEVSLFNYCASIPQELLEKPTTLTSHILVTSEGEVTTYPSQLPTKIASSLSYKFGGCKIAVVDSSSAIELFNGAKDMTNLFAESTNVLNRTSHSIEKNLTYWNFTPNGFKKEKQDNEFSEYIYVADKLISRKADLASKNKIELWGYSIGDNECPLHLSLLMKDGSSYGATFEMQPNSESCTVNLADFKLEETRLVPNHFPSYQYTSMMPTKSMKLSIDNLEKIIFTVPSQSKGVAVGRIVAK